VKRIAVTLKELLGVVVLSVVAGAPSAMAAEGALPIQHLTLQQALARALEVNNGVGRSRDELRIAEAQRRQLLSSILPQVQATGSAIKNSTEVKFGSGADARTILPGNDWNYRIVLSQPIYAGFREKRAYDQAKLNVLNSQEGVAGTEDAVLLRVASNYMAVVDADARIDVERKNIQLAERRRAQSDAFYKAGEVTKVDVLRAETAIKASQRLLAGAQQERENAVSRLRADLNLDGDVAVEHPAHPLPALPGEGELVASAQAARPDVKTAANNVKAAGLEIQKQRGFALPIVTFDAGYIDQKSAFPASRYGYGAFRFTVPIWNSGDVSARVAIARQRELEAQSLLEDAKIAAREDVRRALVDVHSADTTLQLAKEQLTAAQAEYDQAFELYRAQETTSLDLAASETALADARRAVAQEQLNHDLAELRVWYAAGELKNAVGANNR
jgi:outer membrane protein